MWMGTFFILKKENWSFLGSLNNPWIERLAPKRGRNAVYFREQNKTKTKKKLKIYLIL